MNGLALPDRARWLLEACLRDDSRAVEAFGKWRRFADPERMEGPELRLTPLLHANMKRLGLSDQKLAWIGGQAKHIWLSGALRRRKLMPVLDMLEGLGRRARSPLSPRPARGVGLAAVSSARA